MVWDPPSRTQSQSLLKPPLAMFRVDTVKEESSRLFQFISNHASVQPFDTRKFTHRASKPKHSKRSDVEFTWTNRPKNETHPGVPLHVNWHLKEAYAFASSPCITGRFYSVSRRRQHNFNSSRGMKGEWWQIFIFGFGLVWGPTSDSP